MKRRTTLREDCERIVRESVRQTQPDETVRRALEKTGVSAEAALRDNDAYHALDRVGGLIRTGPTGTNVNDVSLLLLRPAEST